MNVANFSLMLERWTEGRGSPRRTETQDAAEVDKEFKL